MSWLFDRLCDLAAADEVGVVLATTFEAKPARETSFDLVNVLGSGADVPGLDIRLLPPDDLGSTLEMDSTLHWIFVTDRADCSEILHRVSQRGLAVAVGAVQREANVHVADMAGALAIVDALITLRRSAHSTAAPAAEQEGFTAATSSSEAVFRPSSPRFEGVSR